MAVIHLGSLSARDLDSPEGMLPGQVVETHKHEEDHVTFLPGPGTWHVNQWREAVRSDGSPVLDQDGTPLWLMTMDQKFNGPCLIHIPAECKHRFRYEGVEMSSAERVFMASLPSEHAKAYADLYDRLYIKARSGPGFCIFANRDHQGRLSRNYVGNMKALV